MLCISSSLASHCRNDHWPIVAFSSRSSWANALWSGLFRTLLNADKVNVQLDRLLQLRKDFEQYLVDSPLQLKRVKQHVLKSNLMMLEQFM